MIGKYLGYAIFRDRSNRSHDIITMIKDGQEVVRMKINKVTESIKVIERLTSMVDRKIIN